MHATEEASSDSLSDQWSKMYGQMVVFYEGENTVEWEQSLFFGYLRVSKHGIWV